LYGNASSIDDRLMREAVVLGVERTMEQDPTFAFRILVDIAIKALSAAINDPTTAVMAIDQLHRLLRLVGLRDLRGEELRDETGALRVVFRTPNWEDYVHLACTEIRHCGAGSIQSAVNAPMLENLRQTCRRIVMRVAPAARAAGSLDRRARFPKTGRLRYIADRRGWGVAGRATVPEAPGRRRREHATTRLDLEQRGKRRALNL
jgi:uncharacterized membrane protein